MAAPILVPVDGSSFSEQAISWAADLAKRTTSALHIVQVHTALHPIAYPEIVPPYEPDWATALHNHQVDYLRQLRDRIGAESGLQAKAALLDGPVVDALVQYAEKHDIGQIVMTSHGRGGLSRAWLGSVAHDLVRLAAVPVLLIHPRSMASASSDLSGVQHILVPLDGSALSESVLPHASALAGMCEARITLIEILPPVYTVSASGFAPDAPVDARAADSARAEAVGYLERIAGELRASGRNVDVVVLAHWQAAHAIIDHAETNAVDLIAIATHGRGAWSRWVVGSVADKVLRSSRVPLLVLQPEHGGSIGSAAAASGVAVALQPS